jgi:hypothetical protein
MQTKKICQYCGREYYVPQSQQNRSKFCSDKCFRANKNKRVEYNCDYCGEPFMITQSQVDKVTNGEKKGLYCCIQCAKDVQKPKWNDIVELFESRGYILLSTEYINAKTKLEYICRQHINEGSQFVTYGNLKGGRACKYCGRERTVHARRTSFDEAKEIFLCNDMILLEQEYMNSHTPMKYICKHHPEVGVQYKPLTNAYKQHCPYCDIPKGESRIKDFLLQLNQYFIPHKTFDGLIGVGNGKLSYDFYLPDLNLLIEYQGEQHEHPVEAFGGDDQFKIRQEHDKRKREYAIKNNIKLLEIWYYDFNQIEQILQQYIKLIA